jgi:hypothetical protein
MFNKKNEIVDLKWIFVIIILLLLVLSFVNYQQKTFEFLSYNLMIIIAMGIFYFYFHHIKLPQMIILSLFLMILFSQLGSNIYLNGSALWDYKFGIMRYDNFVHAINGFMLVFISYNFIAHHLDKGMRKRPVYLALLLILVTLGLGSIWETIEFGEVTFIKNTFVGDYVNNALDLFFNTIGAVIGAISLSIYKNKKRN